MNGNYSAYPSQSEADLGFCGVLASRTADAEQIDRIFRRSGLFRPKWDEMRGAQTYGAMTIATALSQLRAAYQGSPQTAQEDTGGGFLPPPTPPPVDTVFPADIAALLREDSAAFGVPIEIPVACLLALLSCLVGRSRLISVKYGWTEAGNLWLVIVANSGTGKSPPMKAFFAPAFKMEAAAKRAYDQQLAAYAVQEQVHKRILANYAQGLAKGKPAAQPPVEPKKPSRKQTIIDDVTMEVVGSILNKNPKGLLVLVDELSSFLREMNRYKQDEGSMKSRFMSAHSRAPWQTNRVTDPERNTLILDPCVAVFAGTQPGVMKKLFQGGIGGIDEESGFLPRFLFVRAVATAPAIFSHQTLSYQSQKILEGIAAHLWAWDIELDSAGNEIPKVVPVSADARALYIAWYDAIAREAYISPHNAAVLKKAQAHALRLCLLLHCLDAALARTDGMNPIPKDTMQRALRLMDWLLEHQRQCWTLLTPGGKMKQANPLEMAVMQAIVEHFAAVGTNGGKIALGELASLVKKKPEMAQVSNERIGHAATSLKLENCKVNGERAREVTAEQLEVFISTVRTVQTAKTFVPVTNPADANCPATVYEPSAPVQLTTEESDTQVSPLQLHNGTITPAGLPVVFTTAEKLFATLPADVLKNLNNIWSEACQGLH